MTTAPQLSSTAQTNVDLDIFSTTTEICPLKREGFRIHRDKLVAIHEFRGGTARCSHKNNLQSAAAMRTPLSVTTTVKLFHSTNDLTLNTVLYPPIGEQDSLRTWFKGPQIYNVNSKDSQKQVLDEAQTKQLGQLVDYFQDTGLEVGQWFDLDGKLFGLIRNFEDLPAQRVHSKGSALYSVEDHATLQLIVQQSLEMFGEDVSASIDQRQVAQAVHYLIEFVQQSLIRNQIASSAIKNQQSEVAVVEVGDHEQLERLLDQEVELKSFEAQLSGLRPAAEPEPDLLTFEPEYSIPASVPVMPAAPFESDSVLESSTEFSKTIDIIYEFIASASSSSDESERAVCFGQANSLLESIDRKQLTSEQNDTLDMLTGAIKDNASLVL